MNQPIKDFASLVRALDERGHEPWSPGRTHLIKFVYPEGEVAEVISESGLIKFTAGSIVRHRRVTRILTDASCRVIQSTVWLAAREPQGACNE